MLFKVLELFGSATLQTLPTAGSRKFGVPPRGPFDVRSHRLANALLGNDPSSKTLELSLARFTIRVLRDGVIGWVGAGAWQGVRMLRNGEIVTFETPKAGARSYLSCLGGLSAPSSIRVGSTVEANPGAMTDRALSSPPDYPKSLRVYRGIHASLLEWSSFLADRYEVSLDSNRMGVRLKSGQPIRHDLKLTSEPTDVGIIQLPGSGDPIILGPDGPTIGGYPRVACVTEVDLPALAQLRPGEVIRFVEIGRGEGRALLEKWSAEIEQLEILLRLQSDIRCS